MGNRLTGFARFKNGISSASSSTGEEATQGQNGTRDCLGLEAYQKGMVASQDGYTKERTLLFGSTPVVTGEDEALVMLRGGEEHDTRLGSFKESNVKLDEEKSHFGFAPTTEEEKPEKDPYGLFTPLTEEEEDEVLRALGDGSSDEVLARHEASNIEITRNILWCLKSGSWLNDEVINLYFDLLKERERRQPERFLKCHFFNTFFYEKLTSDGYDFTAVRRWTTQKKLGYSLIECDKIFIPVHKGNHWCLAVVNVRAKTFQYLDSLGGAGKDFIGVLVRYLMDEAKDKNAKQMEAGSWRQEYVHNLPQQMNEWDCGMFMLKYIDFYSRGLNLYFGQEHMGYFRKRTVKEILRLKAE